MLKAGLSAYFVLKFYLIPEDPPFPFLLFPIFHWLEHHIQTSLSSNALQLASILSKHRKLNIYSVYATCTFKRFNKVMLDIYYVCAQRCFLKGLRIVFYENVNVEGEALNYKAPSTALLRQQKSSSGQQTTSLAIGTKDSKSTSS